MNRQAVALDGVALRQRLVLGELGGIEEASNGAGDIGEHVARLLALALEALDGHELERGDGEVADGEIGHGGRWMGVC